MALSDLIYNKFEQWRADVSKGVGGLLVAIVGKGIELTLDIVGKAMKPVIMPTIDKLLAQPNMPPEVKEILTKLKTTDGQWQGIVLGGLASSVAGGASSAAFGPIFRYINNQVEEGIRSNIFDYPIILAAWLRGETLAQDIFKDLRMMGYSDDRIELLKKLVYIVPPPPDLIRMAVKEVFTPEIVAKYGQMEDYPLKFTEHGKKIGISEEWAKNYWAAHWDLPSATQGFEMLHRGVITYEDLKILLRALDVMPYWRDKLIEIAYSPYTRVDVRRMYKEAVLDEAGVEKAYKDLGYDEERATRLTEFTLKTYARDEEDVEDEEEKIRELTRADVCDGYRRGLLTEAEAGELLGKLAYTEASTKFYLDREDLKRDQVLKDAYAANYRQLFVLGLKDADTVKDEMVKLGFLATEVDELLKGWYIERIRREARPSRTDLARFLKKEIITEDTWRLAMAELGYADKYIDWYLEDAKV